MPTITAAIATEKTPVRGSLIAAYSLCTEDCCPAEHFHIPEFKRCDRCGALIHNQIFEVVTEAGEELTVGSECMKDILGYKFGTWHERALQVAREIHEKAMKWQERQGYRTPVPVHSLRADDSDHVFAKMGSGQYASEPLFKTSYGFSASLWRAGVDLGLWSGDGYGKRVRVEAYNLTKTVERAHGH